MEYNLVWRNLRVERSNSYKSRVFKFRLMDLDAVFVGIAAKYPHFYINDIAFVCNPTNIGRPSIDEVSDKMAINIEWNCELQLTGNTSAPIVLSGIHTITQR